jgi:hypothetical protein
MSYSLLQAVLRRKFLLPDLYDIMDTVARSLVIHYSAPTRQQCGSLLVSFLLNYPLQSRRIREYFDFLTANLAHDGKDGRESVADALHRIITLFPEEALRPHALPILIALALRLVNEPDPLLKEQVQHVLICLLGRMKSNQFLDVLDMSLKWAKERNDVVEEEQDEMHDTEKEDTLLAIKSQSKDEIYSSSVTETNELSPINRCGISMLSLLVDVSGKAEVHKSNQNDSGTYQIIQKFSKIFSHCF